MLVKLIIKIVEMFEYETKNKCNFINTRRHLVLEKENSLFKPAQPAWLLIGWGGGLWNSPTAFLQRGKTPLTSVLDLTLNNLSPVG